MIHELLYTSHEGKGLRQGSGGGFCSVLSSEGMANNLATALERLSGYKHPFDLHDPRSHDNPVNFRHVKNRIGGVTYHVLSRIADHRYEHTGRSNKLAHHLALNVKQLPSCGPSWVFEKSHLIRRQWNGQVEVVPVIPDSELNLPDLPLGVCRNWNKLAGDAGWAGTVADLLLAENPKPVSVIFPIGADVLPLVHEVYSLLPPRKRWETSFSTFFTSLAPGTTCDLRFVLDETPEASRLRIDRTQQSIDLLNPDPSWVNDASPLVQAARSGNIQHESPATLRKRPPASPAVEPRSRPSEKPAQPAAPVEEPLLGEEDLLFIDDETRARPPTPAPRQRRNRADAERLAAAPHHVPANRPPQPASSRESGTILTVGIISIVVLGLLLMVTGIGIGAYFLGQSSVARNQDDPNQDEPGSDKGSRRDEDRPHGRNREQNNDPAGKDPVNNDPADPQNQATGKDRNSDRNDPDPDDQPSDPMPDRQDTNPDAPDPQQPDQPEKNNPSPADPQPPSKKPNQEPPPDGKDPNPPREPAENRSFSFPKRLDVVFPWDRKSTVINIPGLRPETYSELSFFKFSRDLGSLSINADPGQGGVWILKCMNTIGGTMEFGRLTFEKDQLTFEWTSEEISSDVWRELVRSVIRFQRRDSGGFDLAQFFQPIEIDSLTAAELENEKPIGEITIRGTSIPLDFNACEVEIGFEPEKLDADEPFQYRVVPTEEPNAIRCELWADFIYEPPPPPEDKSKGKKSPGDDQPAAKSTREPNIDIEQQIGEYFLSARQNSQFQWILSGSRQLGIPKQKLDGWDTRFGEGSGYPTAYSVFINRLTPLKNLMFLNAKEKSQELFGDIGKINMLESKYKRPFLLTHLACRAFDEGYLGEKLPRVRVKIFKIFKSEELADRTEIEFVFLKTRDR